MRDLLVTLMVFGSLPLILRKPFFGIIVWTWLSLMNPHRICWGFARSMPYAQIVALVLFASLVISYQKTARRTEVHALTVMLGLWWAWMLITTVFAFFPDSAWEQWNKVWKIMLLTFIIIYLLNTRERLDALVWTMALSLGFYGVKGGIFTLTTGGSSSVYGPAGTFIGGNNEIGLALIMTVPLMRYLQLQAKEKWVRTGLVAAMVLTMISIVATQSRGAFVGLAVMASYLAMKSRKKVAMILLLLTALPLILMMMPEQYHSRLETIQTFEQDGSAMGRINAWWMAFHLAVDYPVTGGGFNAFHPRTFARYAPNPKDFHDAHSIYFEVLGEHGFVGLAIFLSIGIGSLITLKRVQKLATGKEQLTWMRDLSSMVYVSLIGYAVSGAFLGLAYFDFYYSLVAIAIGLSTLMRRYQRDGIPVADEKTVAGSAVRRRGIGAAQPKPDIFKRMVDWYSRL